MKNQIEEKLLAARQMIDEVLAALGTNAGTKPARRETFAAPAVPKSLADNILVLRDSSFFREPRTDKETFEKVRETYTCERVRVSVELFRLFKKRQLRKVSKDIDGKKLVAYTW